LDLVYAILGLVILLLAGDSLVRGAVNLALRLGIPALIVSLTIVAFGTSAPELLISIKAVLDQAPGIAMGNVVGSNTANILLVLGVPALMKGLQTGAHDTRKSYVIMMGASLWFIALCFFGPLVWVHGLLLLGVLFATFVDQAVEVRNHRRSGETGDLDEVEGADPGMPWSRIIMFLALGLVGLPLGADLLVDAAVNIATRMGVSETVIGLTLIAVGTSLPELATTVMAAVRNKADVALGNVIGSNMFNLLAIIGITTFFGPIPVAQTFLKFDLWIMLAASLILAPYVLRSTDMSRMTGAAFVLLYGVYVFSILKWGI
jgi:cation:H+ antiporter